MKKSTVFCILILILSCAFNAQRITFDAELRPRAEFRNRFKTLSLDGLDPAFFTEQRIRLNTFYTSEKVKFRISIQDVRVWGATAQIYKEDPSLTNIYEAWGQYYFTPNSHSKLEECL